uniref:F-box domain-containing protein n=1 Tax=Kalanchoe fedtschenkoi TaxID=63787 RepID=A0A7N0ZT87_KALFE
MGLACSRRGSPKAMSGKLPANLSKDSRNGSLEPRKSTGSSPGYAITSGFQPRNAAAEEIDIDESELCGILGLPAHIIFDIFSRLPLKQVFLCRCTCKTLRRLISSPRYAVLSLDKAQPCLLLREYSRKQFPNFFDRKAYVTDLADETPSTFFYSKAYLVDLEEAEDHVGSSDSNALVKHEIFSLPAGKLELVGSCNGLVCLYQSKTGQYYISNPLLGEWMILPSPALKGACSLICSFFGFCAKLKQFKIVRFTSASLLLSTAAVEITAVGASSWRSIGDGPRPKARGSFSPSPAGDNILFTTGSSSQGSGSGSNIIYAFNLETEQFRPVPSPPHFSPEYLRKLSWVNVGVLRNSLCICYVHNESTLELWTAGSYNSNSNTNPIWTKKFSTSFRYWYILFRMDKHHPAVFLDNNYDLWMKHEGTRNLYKFSPEIDEMRAFKVSGAGGTGFEIVAHVPSFVRLADSVGPEVDELEVFRYGYKLWSP